MTITDPSKYCRNQKNYEKHLVLAVDEIGRLFREGYIADKAGSHLFEVLLSGLYGIKE